MTDDAWTAIEMLLEECWPGQWGKNTGRSYRLMLDAFDPGEVVGALRLCAASGGFGGRPSVTNIMARLTEDPTEPTWSEAFEAIYGRDGVLAVPSYPKGWESEQDRMRKVDEAVLRRAAEFHPFVAGFVEMVTPRRLAEIGVGDEQWGQARREQLRKEWAEWVERARERHRRGLPMLTGGRRQSLGRLDVSAMIPRRPAGQLVSGHGLE